MKSSHFHRRKGLWVSLKFCFNYFAFLSILVYICLVKFVCALMSIQAGQELGGEDSSRGSMREPNYWLTQEDIALAARDVYGMHNGANSRVITPCIHF